MLARVWAVVMVLVVAGIERVGTGAFSFGVLQPKRHDQVVVAVPPKSGTTLLLQASSLAGLSSG